MAFSVNTNSSALEALRQLVGTNRSLEITQSRINTGLDVRTAADDPANFSIAQNLRGQVRGFEAVRSSLDRATSTVDIAIAAAETISDLLIDMRETTIAAADSGIDSQSRQALSDEFSRLLEQVNSVVSQANFNGTNIVDPSLTRITALTGTEVAVNDINADGIVDAGEAKLSNIIEINGRDLTTNGLGIAINNFEIDPALGYDVNINDLSAVAQNLDDRDFVNALVAAGNADNIIDPTTNPASFDFSGVTFPIPAAPGNTISLGGQNFTIPAGTTQAQLEADFSIATATPFTITATPADNFSSNVRAEQALVDVDNALQQVNSVLAEFGAAARQLELSTNFTIRLSDELQVGIGNLVDADLARESASLQALQVKQQLGLQALSIANRSPQSILSLFGGN
ncbi:flagellin A [Iodidimonas nitroreducens]|uniref:Flagellin n=1 Tax=Iodidimonas nitroreducens TaxID=1236968 RepID=A0A5A7N3F6_9PROT|nr:flagellin [Iodidimonas nitroreducens]GAK34341.1 flagellin A [alpha proteobacterium Q-1]GER02812.1 flagellin A [Iodidimonas nitroreducens]